jgi:ubiquinone/menaquinone biosynthesis C-methylase UbiE
MPPEHKSIPKSFYGSNFILTRIPLLSYRAYRTARDGWLNALPPPDNLDILDIGCSTGEALEKWAPQNRLTGLDHEPSVLIAATQRGYTKTVVGDMLHLPFEPQTFDAAVAMGMIGSAQDPKDRLTEFNRILKKGGKLYLAVAVYGGIRRITRKIVTLCRIKNQMVTIPTLAALEKDLSACGFSVDSLATSPLYPRAAVHFTPTDFDRKMAVYAFIVATKKT